MLTIRLQRVGHKNVPLFRVVVTDSQNPPRGKFLEVVGSYSPKSKQTALKTDKIKEYLAHGAACSETVWNMLVRAGVVKGAKRAIKSTRSRVGAAHSGAQAEPAFIESPEAPATEPKTEVEAAAASA